MKDVVTVANTELYRCLSDETANKKSERLPLETKNTLQIENWSLGFIETLHKQ